MLRRVIYLDGREEFIRVLYDLESVLIGLSSTFRVVMISKMVIRDVVPLVKEKRVSGHR